MTAVQGCCAKGEGSAYPGGVAADGGGPCGLRSGHCPEEPRNRPEEQGVNR